MDVNTKKGIITNDTLLWFSLCCMALLAVLDYYLWKLRSKTLKKRRRDCSKVVNKEIDGDFSQTLAVGNGFVSYPNYSKVPIPVHRGLPRLIPEVLDIGVLNQYMPVPKSKMYNFMDTTKMPKNESRTSFSHSDGSVDENAEIQVETEVEAVASLNDRDSIVHCDNLYEWVGLAELMKLPGCSPESKEAKKMEAKFPDVPMHDIIRFLVARKGNFDQASEMLTKRIAWFNSTFPLKKSTHPDVVNAMKVGCLFPFGTDRDGAPIVYLRGALYDNTKAPWEAYVLAAAHSINYVCERHKQIAVTVLVHAVAVPGAANANPDMAFIKGFVKVLSDNYPERLKRLIIFPFPSYGKAIWSMIKWFVDPRTVAR